MGREIIKTDVRIISATNKNLLTSVENQTFREDLFYRINVINIELPPLRQRENDIIDLSNHFISKFSNNSQQIDSNVINFIKKYEWPGNVRELENLFKRVSVLSGEKLVSIDTVKNLIDRQPKVDDFSVSTKNKNLEFQIF